MLTKKAVEEFRQIWKEKFNEDISYERAETEGIKLLEFFKLIYKPIPKQKTKK